MLRRLFQLLTIGSSLILALILLMWMRSYRKADFYFRVTELNWTHFTSSRGRIDVYWKTSDVRRFGPQKLYHGVTTPARLNLDLSDPYIVRRLVIKGLGAMHTQSPYGSAWEIVLPDWVIAMFFGVLPANQLLILKRRWNGQWRVTQGLCSQCGYDLRASEGRCPECGLELRSSEVKSSSGP